MKLHFKMLLLNMVKVINYNIFHNFFFLKTACAYARGLDQTPNSLLNQNGVQGK